MKSIKQLEAKNTNESFRFDPTPKETHQPLPFFSSTDVKGELEKYHRKGSVGFLDEQFMD